MWDFLHHIYSGDNWWVTTDVAVPVCGHSGLWPFRFVAVSVCDRFGLWRFRFVGVPVCSRSGLWPFRSVAVPVCGRFGLWPFRFVAVSVVAASVCGRYDLLSSLHRFGSLKGLPEFGDYNHGPCFIIMTFQLWISSIEIKRSRDSLIFIMRIS